MHSSFLQKNSMNTYKKKEMEYPHWANTIIIMVADKIYNEH